MSLILLASTIVAESEFARHCNIDLLHSYNMHGLDEPKEVVLEMCPNIHMSCCKKTDQLEMYNNWIHSKEKDLIETHYRAQTESYSATLDVVLEVHKFAEKILKKLEVKRVANCKVIAERILTFKTGDILAQIKANLRKMEDFFTQTYQGFYCAICNHDNHRHFDMDKSLINFSEKFCRDIVENTLPVVIFWYDDVIKYFNLISKFILSCDYKGDYKAEALIPKNFIFVEDDLIAKQLGECRDFRNKKSWFTYCGDLCHAFSMSKFSNFFEPHKDMVQDFTAFVKNTLFQVLSMEGRDPSFAEHGQGKLSVHRVLFDQDHTNSENKKASQAEDDEPVIFQAGFQSKIKLESFKSVFGGDGISLYDDGKNSLINTEMYNEIKTKLHLEYISIVGSPKLDETDKQLIAAMNASILSAGLLASFLLWIFN